MAVGFTAWTVLPHDPIVKVSPNLWYVTGKMNEGKNQRMMVVARRSDGDLIVHNPIALDEAEMAELEAFGTPSYMIVPNSFHRQDAFIWKSRFPNSRVIAPKGARKAVEKAVPVQMDYEGISDDEIVSLAHLEGTAGAEGVMLVHDPEGTTAVFCDAVMNVKPMGFPWGFLLAPTGVPATPRLFQWMSVKDKAAFAGHLRLLADREHVVRILPGHGTPMDTGASEVLRAVAARVDGGEPKAG
jgi:hypothetical protein